MGSDLERLFTVFGVIAACVVGSLALIFVGVPVLKGVGGAVGAAFRGIGWLVRHIADFVVGMLGDAVRLVGTIIAGIVLLPLMVLSVVFGRWSRASHFASGVSREARVFGGCLYRLVLRRPLKLLLLGGLLEGIEQRVPEAVLAAPGPDQPGRRTGQFDGYRIVGSLRPGGSGAKLYVAEPEDAVRAKHPGMPELVVIKSFAITDGSSLPQIVRESRSLESARQMKLILDHGLDEHRFFYVMPYHAGENLGVVTRQLHGESGAEGLEGRALRAGVGYVGDLVATLATYHAGGLWHKDVKPDNIIIHNGAAHLVDLGLVTPLRSAMTLTTHGTEYFRDPEMVRQALRGVKVHEVDGAKFDIYAAGACLYFVLENTFPAHGALSAFTKRSPEALRWIVRRAMAEYTKRYDSAAIMLADVRHVLASADPYAVRPADLPSMRGVLADAVPGMVGSGVGAVGPQFANAAAAIGAAAVGAVGAGAAVPARPRIRVTNWWTGAYVVDDMAAQAPPAVPQADSWRRQAVAAAESFRPAAEAQLASARRRAGELRTRARARVAQHVARRPHQPSKGLIVLTSLAIAAICGTALFGVTKRSHRLASSRAMSVATNVAGSAVPRIPHLPFDHAAVVQDSIGGASQAADAVAERIDGVVQDIEAKIADRLNAARRAAAASASAAPSGGTIPSQPKRAILVNTHTDPANPAVLSRIEAEVARHAAEGWLVCAEDIDACAALAPVIPAWAREHDRFDAQVEDALEQSSYAAVLWVYTEPGSGPAANRTGLMWVTSTRAGASERRGGCGSVVGVPASATADAPEAPDDEIETVADDGSSAD